MSSSRWLAIGLLSVLVAASPFVERGVMRAEAAQTPDATRDDTFRLVLPTRRAADPSPSAHHDLPPGAERVRPVTLDTVIHRQPVGGRPQTLRQTITRTVDRIHVLVGHEREWLFERNVRDPRRVSGTLVEHVSHAIVVYEESDLRNLIGIRGWVNALTLGFDLDLLAGLELTGQTRTIGGIAFARYTARGKRAVNSELWWSADQLFPSSFVTADSTGSTRFSVEDVRVGADVARLRTPASRFPEYHVFDVAEWLEQH